MLLTLLPFYGWADDATDVLVGTPGSMTYNGTAPNLVVKEVQNAQQVDVTAQGTWSTEDGVLTEGANPVPTAAAGTYTWTKTATPTTKAYFTIAKKQIVYFLTGATYSVGDVPDVTRSYSLANGNSFIGDDKLEDFATFAFATSGNDALDDLDDNGRFQNIRNYNISALRVIEKPVHQNYDFRFTSTAVIVVTAKSIAGFVYNDVEDQTYTGSQITFAGGVPAIYASAADRDAAEPIALNPDNYDVSYGVNVDVVYNNNHQVVNGGTIIYTGKGNYEGTLTVPFKITPRELVTVTVDELPNATYALGEEIIPNLQNKVKGTDAEGQEYTLVNTLEPAHTDYAVAYNGTNINAGQATGTITAAEGNFRFAANATIDDVEFTIDPKNLGDEEIVINMEPIIADAGARTYTGAQIKPEPAVNWKVGEALTPITNFIKYTYGNETDNIAVGKGYITIEPKAVEAPAVQNYTGSQTVSFDILPTDLETANATITLQKNNSETDEPNWVEAAYQYEGDAIQPGVKDRDGRVLVTIDNGEDPDIVLVEGTDYEIVSYDNATYYTDAYDNTNAFAKSNKKAVVFIKGIGNYGKINAQAKPITIKKEFEIAQRALTISAKPVSTTFGVAPAPTVEDHVITNLVDGEDIGAVITPLDGVQVRTMGETQWGEWSNYGGELNALEVTSTAETPAQNSKEYQYKPSLTLLQQEPQQDPQEDVTYATAEQLAARLNYNTANTNATAGYAKITVTNAKWIIVVNDVTKTYSVTDENAGFGYKVYNGSYDPQNPETNLVENPVFDENAAPVIGRKAGNQGEDVVTGGYTISVLNDGVAPSTGTTVAKTGYTIEVVTGKLTIEPFELTLTAADQTINYGGELETDTDEDSWAQEVVAGVQQNSNKLTVTFAPVMLANGTLIDREALNLTLTPAESYTGNVGTYENALIPALGAGVMNFIVREGDAKKGTIKVLVSDALILDPTDAELANKIAAAATEGTHTVTFANMPTMKAKEWYAVVLPFATTPAELVAELGNYVVVNRLSTESALNDIKFRLEMDELPAGEPFLIKAASAIDWTNAEFVLTPIAKDPADVETAGATFKGVYADQSIQNGYNLAGVANATYKYKWLCDTSYKTYNQNDWVNPNNSARVIKPLEAFLLLPGATDENNVRITVEDFDGQTTSIQTLSGADVNAINNQGWYTVDGIKLQSAPTEKGIYINNGKKVVIK